MQRSRPSLRSGRATRSVLAAVLAALVAPARAQEPAPEPAITRAELERTVRFLAADELAGRATGSPELDEAARYLARAFERAGLEPAGDEGGFLQAVPLVRIGLASEPELALFDGAGAESQAEYGRSFTVRGGGRVAGRFRVVVAQAPEDLPSAADAELALFVDALPRRAEEWLEEAGHPDGVGFGVLVLPGSRREQSADFSPWSRVLPLGLAGSAAPPRVRVHGALRERFKAGEVAVFDFAQEGIREEVASYNVIARLSGVGSAERPELAREAVVFSAHYDHIGTRSAPAEGDPAAGGQPDLVYNGADDDASGTATVLELAHAFAAGEPPARTLIFLLATGEERGLIGTEFYLEHPPVPLADTVCNLNFEMVGRPDELVGGAGKLWLTGHEHSNLLAAIQEHGIRISPDLRPQERFFRRSDNWAFVERGIVGQTLSSYSMHDDYHRVTDEADTLDYAHMEACARAAYRISRLLADGSLDPAWLPGKQPATGR